MKFGRATGWKPVPQQIPHKCQPASPLADTIENRGTGPRIEWFADLATTTFNSLKPAESVQFHHEEQAVRHRE